MIEKNKIIATISLLTVFTLSFGSALAEYANTNYLNKDNSYKDAIVDTNIIEFKAERDAQVIKMKWTNYNKSDFMYYKIMRSETHENPVYPDQPAIRVLDNNDITELKINNYSEKNAIYRVCVITKEKDRYCSNIVKLEGFDKESYKNTNEDKENKYKVTNVKAVEYKKAVEEKKTEYKEKKEVKKANISEKLAKRADLVVENFTKKIEKKYSDNEKRIATIEKVMTRLNNLAEKNEKLASLVEHMNMKLKEKMEKYNDSFDEIEEIFNSID